MFKALFAMILMVGAVTLHENRPLPKPRMLWVGDSIAYRLAQEGAPVMAKLEERYEVDVLRAPYIFEIPQDLPQYDVIILCAGYHDKAFGVHDRGVRAQVDMFKMRTDARRFAWVDTRDVDALPKSRIDFVHLTADGYDELAVRYNL